MVPVPGYGEILEYLKNMLLGCLVQKRPRRPVLKMSLFLQEAQTVRAVPGCGKNVEIREDKKHVAGLPGAGKTSLANAEAVLLPAAGDQALWPPVREFSPCSAGAVFLPTCDQAQRPLEEGGRDLTGWC